MKYTIRVLLLLLIATSTVEAGEDAEELLHGAAHVGASYSITHGTQVICERLTKIGPQGCLAIGIATAVAAGVTKEIIDGNGKGQNHAKGMTYNAVGITAATTMISLQF